jgi:hypothetical protein
VATLVLLALPVPLVRQELLDLPALPDLLVRPELRVLKDRKVTLVLKGLSALPALLVLLALWVQRVPLARQALILQYPDLLVRLVRKAIRVPLDRQAQPEQQAQQVPMVLTE